MGSRSKKAGKGYSVPGPGQYNPDVRASKEDGPMIRIGTATREQGRPATAGGGKDMPGPGNYSIGYSNHPTPSFGFGTG
jgi:hypothetical protein